jgi:hypothetical protein
MHSWRKVIHPDDAIPTEMLLQQALNGTRNSTSSSAHLARRLAALPEGRRHDLPRRGRPADAHGRRELRRHRQPHGGAELRRHRIHLEELVAERTNALSVAVRQAQAATAPRAPSWPI